MQTFLPYPDFKQSVKSLDYRRLGKQRVEAFQLLKALELPTYGWQNHPATNMWRGYESALAVYMNCCIQEWVLRGYNNSMSYVMDSLVDSDAVRLPPWIGDSSVHLSHQSNLYRKDPVFYSKFAEVGPNLPYVWPKGDLNYKGFALAYKRV